MFIIMSDNRLVSNNIYTNDSYKDYLNILYYPYKFVYFDVMQANGLQEYTFDMYHLPVRYSNDVFIPNKINSYNVLCPLFQLNEYSLNPLQFIHIKHLVDSNCEYITGIKFPNNSTIHIGNIKNNLIKLYEWLLRSDK